MIHIHFIINPISGSGKNELSEAFLGNYFSQEKYSITTKISEYKRHAITLTAESIREEAQIIVACGGDGTINEVASALVNTGIPLGIIPMGSGNGLASNLKIPKQLEKAIGVILRNKYVSIDVGRVNDSYFFSNTGFGFDASVIKNYEESQRRSLLTYVTASLKSFKEYHRQDEIVIEINGTTQMVNPFLIFVSNSNVMGYGMSLTPKASLQDGLFDVVIVPKLPKLKMLVFGLLMLLKRPDFQKEVSCFQAKEIKLFKKSRGYFQSQIDGELVEIPSSSVDIDILQSSLIVLA
ncbi:diacylglycerol/lipid kinase family protein [Aequorivita marisscotiae]|uniref:Diacylglycerol kinase family lipid kinase n=1 Tax=Aequorivita marisscotiae TaxID=3040348 RepID=A0ABY8KUJ3_9FLAO|nr:diacylglycerol kinase family lipid kinase [Aequorivita sp. Ant34-E75]WGF91730.1 diacylglycerol kinase family lipid kinase [Aequorivita sp. Ant34-E75]HNP68747.1 diacylglycerol kinase family lipid kinase [Aequorivita sp.]